MPTGIVPTSSPTTAAVKKVGVVLQHYDARNDIRELMQVLSGLVEIVLLGHAGALKGFRNPAPFRAFRPKRRGTRWLWQNLFSLFGDVPASRDNFQITELFRLTNFKGFERIRGRLRLRCRMRFGNQLSYDDLLHRLAQCDGTPNDDLDAFLFLTQVSDDPFLAHVLRSRRRAAAYVYSWDHPCKHPSFTKRIGAYAVWNDGIAQDIQDLHGIPRAQCVVVGSTQLAIVKEHIEDASRPERPFERRYFYFGCGVGFPGMATQEILLIRYVAETGARAFPEHLLVVRPYPHLADTSLFAPLRGMENVVFDDEWVGRNQGRSLSRGDIRNRLAVQERADAFLHVGTTMGLEGAYLDTPVLFLALEDFDYGLDRSHEVHLMKFARQYHNEKYMLLSGHPNVVTRTTDLEDVLRLAARKDGRLRQYNHQIASTTPLRSLRSIGCDLVGLLGAGSTPQSAAGCV